MKESIRFWIYSVFFYVIKGESIKKGLRTMYLFSTFYISF